MGVNSREGCHMPDNYKALVKRLVEDVWTNGHFDALDDLVHPDAHPPHGPWDLPRGPEGFRRFVGMIRTSFPDITRSVEDMVEEGDRLVLYYRLRGTHTGAGGLVPYPPTGERWDMLGVTAFRFADGKIIEEPWAVNTVSAMFSLVAKANVRNMIEVVWNSQDTDAIATYYAPEFVYHGPDGAAFKGRDGLRQVLSSWNLSMPEARLEIEDQIAEGDKVVTRWRLEDGDRDAGAGTWLIRFEDGLAAEEWETRG